MSAHVLVIGLDAAEATLIERWASAGLLPTFARLSREGTVCRLKNSLETLPGAIWPELASGRSCGQVPLYYHPRQLHTGEARIRPVMEDEVNANEYYWNVASHAGKKVAALDIPQSVRNPDINGVQLFEWGLHDRNFHIATEPPEFLDELTQRYGVHPIKSCDLHGETMEGYRHLLENLLEGVARKTELLLDVLNRESWDLFTCAYGETHCVGHQFWHFFDESYQRHDPSGAKEFKNAIFDVYQKADEGISKLIAAAGDNATVLVVTSHGMGPYTGGPNLLPEVLVRLGMGSGGSNKSAWVRRLQLAVSHMPRSIQPLLRKIAYTGVAKKVQSSAGCLLDPLESPKTRAVALRNNRCGAIRLNLRGREPNGCIEPGPEADRLTEEIRNELYALVHPKSGEKVIKTVVTATEAFGEHHHPDVPDLMVVFRTDLGILEECVSERVGHITAPLYHPNIPRSGDHTVESRLWIKGPGVPAGIQMNTGNVLDIAPTILRLLGIEPPGFIDGVPMTVFHGKKGG